MNLLRYLSAALIMYRSAREGRQPATCCGCGTSTAELTTWAIGANPNTHEGWCRGVATLSSHQNWDEYDAAALAAWPARILVPAWLTAP